MLSKLSENSPKKFKAEAVSFFATAGGKDVSGLKRVVEKAGSLG